MLLASERNTIENRGCLLSNERSERDTTSDVLEHKWRASLKTILFLYLISNTEATENKVQFFNLAYRVKGFQCHSNNSLQLLELKEKTTTTKQYTLFKSFLCDIL